MLVFEGVFCISRTSFLNVYDSVSFTNKIINQKGVDLGKHLFLIYFVEEYSFKFNEPNHRYHMAPISIYHFGGDVTSHRGWSRRNDK